jgi:hypothetical protein
MKNASAYARVSIKEKAEETGEGREKGMKILNETCSRFLFII